MSVHGTNPGKIQRGLQIACRIVTFHTVKASYRNQLFSCLSQPWFPTDSTCTLATCWCTNHGASKSLFWVKVLDRERANAIIISPHFFTWRAQEVIVLRRRSHKFQLAPRLVSGGKLICNGIVAISLAASTSPIFSRLYRPRTFDRLRVRLLAVPPSPSHIHICHFLMCFRCSLSSLKYVVWDWILAFSRGPSLRRDFTSSNSR